MDQESRIILGVSYKVRGTYYVESMSVPPPVTRIIIPLISVQMSLKFDE
jgi:hypothetical protein